MCSNTRCFFNSELDGDNTLKFYFIDLLEAVIRSIQDPTLEGKLYNSFETFLDHEGMRVLPKQTPDLCLRQ